MTCGAAHIPRVCLTMMLAGVLPLGAARGQANVSATTAPGEEVMHPTQHGVRLTPNMAHALAMGFVKDSFDAQLDLTPEQEQRFTDRLAGRMMTLASQNATSAEAVFERMCEWTMRRDADPERKIRIAPDELKALGEAGLSLLPSIRQLFEGIVEDGKTLLDASQQRGLEQMLGRRDRMFDSIDETLHRWTRGEIQRPDNPMQEIDDSFRDPPQQNWAVLWARRNARSQSSEIGPQEWAKFLASARVGLRFDEKQVERGQAILNAYRIRADVIMTPAWRKRVQQNRVRRSLIDLLKDQPTAPAGFRLDEQYCELARPLEEMAAHFEAEVLAIATDAQRAAFLADIADRAAQHGLAMDDLDRELLVLQVK